MASGRFDTMHPRLAFDLVTGPVLAGLHSLLTSEVPPTYAEDMAQAVLMFAACPRPRRAGSRPLPIAEIALAPDSLLVRAQARAAPRPDGPRTSLKPAAGATPPTDFSTAGGGRLARTAAR